MLLLLLYIYNYIIYYNWINQFIVRQAEKNFGLLFLLSQLFGLAGSTERVWILERRSWETNGNMHGKLLKHCTYVAGHIFETNQPSLRFQHQG